jgi:hypothetical protein
MNFFELDQQVSQQTSLTPASKDEAGIDKNGYIRIAGKIAQKLGEKSNTYTPLVRYVARNPKMLQLLEKLIEETSLAQSGKLKAVVSSYK